MKKFLRILLITIGAIFILLITLPILFKSKIEAFVKEQVNQNVYATVDWSRFGISMIRGFPDLSINLHQVSVVGVEPFKGDTLVGLKRFEFRVNPFSAIRKNLQVKSILLDRPLINGIVLEDGTANWDIVPETEIEDGDVEVDTMKGPDTESGTSMGLTLKRFAIRDGRIYYKDEMLDVDASLEGYNMELTGDFSMDQTELTLKMMINRINAKYEGIRYMRDGSFGLDLIAAANMVDNVYTLQKNQISLNGLVLGAEGVVSLMEDGAMDIDLNFFSQETSFHTLLSLVPAIYLTEFETLKTSGNLQLDGSVTGIMKDSILPDATLNLVVSDGYFAYPDLPKDVSDVQIRLNVDYRGTNMDETTVDLNEFHMLIGGNPFDMNLHVAHPISDMHVAGKALGMIDFASLQDVIPLEDVRLEGRLETDFSWDTRLSYIEQEQFEKVDMAGSLVIEGVRLAAPEIPVEVKLQRLELDFNPRIVDLVTLDLILGSSDLHMEGKLTNFIPYIFDDQTISGSLNISSGLLDVNELLPELEEDSVAVISEMPADSIAEPAQVRIPENIDFIMALDLKKVIYDQILVENIFGNMVVREGVANLEQLKMDIIEGTVTSTGMVDTRGEFAEVNVSLEMKGVDIPASYETFMTVERLAPMAKYCKGTANVKMQYHSLLDASFSPVYHSIDAKGRVFTSGLQIYNLNTFVRLSELLKNEKFRDMAPDEVDLGFTIREGRVMVDPFDMDFDDSKITVSGSHGIDQTMDYLLDMQIAKSDLGAEANELMSGITALAAGAGFQIPQSDNVKVKARITGTFNDPKVTTDFSENLKSAGESVKATVKEKITEEVEKVEEKVRDEASEKAEKIISDAEAEAERLVEQARKAGDDLVKEAELQGENLIKEAGNNPFKQIAAKKAAEELKRQAQKQSDNLVREAEVKADEIIEKAREKAEKL
ncbi:MAG: AsmA family protein [Bacteroidales bacterium]|nr:AsmA family protein [Bacteroidales bacterium]